MFPSRVFDDPMGEIIGGRVGEIVVVRHGQTEWSRSGQHTGVTDLPLLPDGEEDGRRLRAVLAQRRITHAFVSPLVRARRTAELAGLLDGAIGAEIDPDLVEVDYGAYEGRTTKEISAELGRPWSLWSDGTVPGDTPGETLQQVAERVDRVLAKVAATARRRRRRPGRARARAAHPDRPLAGARAGGRRPVPAGHRPLRRPGPRARLRPR